MMEKWLKVFPQEAPTECASGKVVDMATFASMDFGGSGGLQAGGHAVPG